MAPMPPATCAARCIASSKRRRQTPSPVFFSGAGYAVFQNFPAVRSGAPKTRRLARRPGRLGESRPTRLRGVSPPLAIAERRLSALHPRRFQSPDPRFLGRGKCASPSPAKAPRGAAVVPPERGPGASRVRGNEPRPQAPHPIPLSKRLMTTPSVGWDIWYIFLYVGKIMAGVKFLWRDPLPGVR
jgi:hypothetical protein